MIVYFGKNTDSSLIRQSPNKRSYLIHGLLQQIFRFGQWNGYKSHTQESARRPHMVLCSTRKKNTHTHTLTIMTKATGPMKLQMKWLSTLSQQLQNKRSNSGVTGAPWPLYRCPPNVSLLFTRSDEERVIRTPKRDSWREKTGSHLRLSETRLEHELCVGP